MADKKISEFDPAPTPLKRNSQFALVQDGVTYNTTLDHVAAAVGSKRMALPLSSSIADPTDLTFTRVRQFRYADPFAPRLMTSQDDLAQDWGGYSTVMGSGSSTTFVDGGVNMKVNLSADNIRISPERFAVPQFALGLDVHAKTTDSGSLNVVQLGIQDASRHNVLYAYAETGDTNFLNLALFVNNTTFTILAQVAYTLPTTPFKMALTVDNTSVILWLDIGRGWEPKLQASYDYADLDLGDPAVLAGMHPFFGVSGGVTAAWKFDNFYTGYGGQFGFRDWKLVTYKDGTPYTSDGYTYLTASVPGHLGVYRMNVLTGAFEKTGILYTERGGALKSDLNAKIVFDDDENFWRVLTVSWANGLSGPLTVSHVTFRGDILNGVHILPVGSGDALALTGDVSNDGVYDADMVWDGTRWLVAYTIVPNHVFSANFYAALDESTDLVSFSALFKKTGTVGYEGTILQKVGGDFYVFAGNGSNVRAWNAAGTDLGTMNLSPFPNPGGDPPPHLLIIPVMDGAKTRFFGLSWQNTEFKIGGSGLGAFTTGTPVLYEAAETEDGFEFDAVGIV